MTDQKEFKSQENPPLEDVFLQKRKPKELLEDQSRPYHPKSDNQFGVSKRLMNGFEAFHSENEEEEDLLGLSALTLGNKAKKHSSFSAMDLNEQKKSKQSQKLNKVMK